MEKSTHFSWEHATIHLEDGILFRDGLRGKDVQSSVMEIDGIRWLDEGIDAYFDGFLWFLVEFYQKFWDIFG